MGMKATVDKLVETLGGVNFTLTRTTQGAYVSGGTGDYATASTLTDSGLCVLEYSSGLANASFIKNADVKILIKPSFSIRPEANDEVTINSKSFNIVEVQEVYFKGELVLYTCFAKRF
jgi:hypothetical protein